MTAHDSFQRAIVLERWGERLFRAVFLLSAVALMAPEEWITNVINPALVVACFVGVALSYRASVSQNEGNHALRASQLADGFQVPVGAAAAKDYYNNRFPPSVDRLVAATFENSLFSLTVLGEMLRKERFIIAIYAALFVAVMTFRWTSTNALVLFAQTLFSADLVLHWLRMERFHNRVSRVNLALHQFFTLGGTTGDPKGLAVALGAFADYEAAKEEAAMPLDGAIFEKINPTLCKEWDQLRQSLKIP